jgi:hypothetical protein
MDTESGLNQSEYHPELISRRGELIAWTTAFMALAAWGILLLVGAPVHPALKFLATFLLLSALAISLGNWMDRHTLLRIEADGIRFENGLRRAHLQWDEIQQVQVFPSNWGKKVRILGGQVHFDFRTLGEVTIQGDVKGRMGFADGEAILKKILQEAGLKKVERPGSGEYYARQ